MNSFFSELSINKSIRYKSINKETADLSDWTSVTIEGCVLNGCNIINTNLFSSDLICSTLSFCKFCNVNMEHSDICSIIISDTAFENVDFSTATMRDCEYKNCTFIVCRFEHIAMTHCKFTNCTFKSISIEQSSSYLNEFCDCQFKSCYFKGNFFYSLFYNCNLCSNIFTESIRAFNALLNNTESINITEDEKMLNYLNDNNMFLNIEIYRLNLKKIKIDTFVFESIIAISQLIRHNIVIQLEQMEFLQKIIEYTCIHEPMPLLTLQHCISVIDRIFEDFLVDYISVIKAQKYLNQIKNLMYIEYVCRINSLPKIKEFGLKNKNNTTYKITYKEQPSVQIVEIINRILLNLNKSSIKAKQLKTEKGSFIEFVSLLKEAEPLIQIILAFTTGVLTPVVLEKVKTKSQKNTKPQSSNTINITNSKINCPTTVYNYNTIIQEFNSETQYVVNATSQALNEYSINAENEYLGYSKDNVIKVEIISSQDKK